jgi:hypothetical protein
MGYGSPPEMWGRFCYPVRGIETVKAINLIKFYQVGRELKELSELTKDTDRHKAWMALINTQRWLMSFSIETRDLPMSKAIEAADKLRVATINAYKRIAEVSAGDILPLTDSEAFFIHNALEEFEHEFDVDSQHMSIFCVTPKGDLDINVLLDDASRKFARRCSQGFTD